MILQVNLSQSCPDILSQAMQCELSEQLNSQLGKASDDGTSAREGGELTATYMGSEGLILTGDSTGLVKSWHTEEGSIKLGTSADFYQADFEVKAISQAGGVLALGGGNGQVTVLLVEEGSESREEKSCQKTRRPIRTIDINQKLSVVVFASFCDAFAWYFLTGVCVSLPGIYRSGEVQTYWTLKTSQEQVFAHMGGKKQLVCWQLPQMSDFVSPAIEVERTLRADIAAFALCNRGFIILGSDQGSLEVFLSKGHSLLVASQVLPIDHKIRQIQKRGSTIYLLSTFEGGTSHKLSTFRLKLDQGGVYELDPSWKRTLSKTYFDIFHMRVEENIRLLMCGEEGPLLTECLATTGWPTNEVAEEMQLDISFEEQVQPDSDKKAEEGDLVEEVFDGEEDDETNILNSDSGESRGGEKDLNPRKGMTFDSRAEARQFIEAYERRSRVSLVVKRSTGDVGILHMQCKHGQKRKSTSKGIRPWQKTEKFDCPFQINCYTAKSGHTRVTSVNLLHSHPTTKAIYVQDSAKVDPEARATIKQLLKANCNPHQIKKALNEEGKVLRIQQIRYAIRQLQGAPMDEERLDEFLKVVEEEGGRVEVKRSPDNKVQAIVIVTGRMKRAFTCSSSSCVQLDSTFGIETSGYKLAAILYHSKATNRGEIAGLCFLADETKETLTFALTSFKEITATSPRVWIIDKDLVEWMVIQEVFLDAIVLLCSFHVLQWMDRIISSAWEDQDDKLALTQAFHDMVYARDEEIFKEKLMVFETLADGVEVRTGGAGTSTDLLEYFNRCWRDNKNMWCHADR